MISNSQESLDVFIQFQLYFLSYELRGLRQFSSVQLAAVLQSRLLSVFLGLSRHSEHGREFL